MIKYLKAVGLNDKINCELNFNSDLNILTGKNGSGKTTVLKLIWYLISGNIERVFREMTFESIKVETSKIVLSIYKFVDYNDKKESVNFYKFNYTINGIATENAFRENSREISNEINELNNSVASATGSSLFFPTFRRIEGGIIPHEDESRFSGVLALEEAMVALSERVSVYSHKFVSSISTQDIVRLITERYANVSEQTNNLHSELSASITEMIQDYKQHIDIDSVHAQDVDSDSVLQAIKVQVDEVTATREQLLRPFSTLSDIIDKVFGKPVKITENITFGKGKAAILSDKLSAGEKQILSFFCYNAFFKDSPIFIDEPELSLHTDWQSILFPNLLKQKNGNQFVIATHSPFIYAKYPDKELVLNEDRGE